MNVDDAREAITKHISDIQTVTPIHAGVNTTFSVTTDDDDYIIKFGTFDPSSVRLEPTIIHHLHNNSLPVPQIHGEGRHQGTPYFIAEKLHGELLPYPDTLSSERIIEVVPVVGEFLGQLHTIETGVGRLRRRNGELSTTGTEWEQFYRGMLEKFAHQAKGNYSSLGSKAMELVHWTPIPDLETAVFSPIDLHTGNLFLDDDGRIEGAIDFERIYGGHPGLSYEVTLHTLSAGREQSVRKRIEERFSQGYERVQTPPQHYDAFELIAVLREMRAAHMWWDSPEEHRERLEKRLEEVEYRIKSDE